MDISTHIAYLLQFHECVIIPEFGGFISNYKPAQFDTVKQVFNPPSKELVFNTKINRNDGLLINYIVEVEKLGYHQAQSALISFVDQMFLTLEKGEKVYLSDVGSFEYDRSGNVIFTAQSKLDLIDIYGLKPISYPTLYEAKQHITFKPRPAVRALNNKKDFIKMAASISLLLALSLFPMKNNKVELQLSNLNPIQLLLDNQPERVTPKVKDVKPLPAEVLTNKAKTKKDPYILVGGSFQKFENANDLQRELTLNGYKAEIIEQDNGFYRVIIDSYQTREKAVLSMNTFLSNHPGSNVWVSIR